MKFENWKLKNIVFSVAMLPVAGFGLTSPVSQLQDWWGNFNIKSETKSGHQALISDPKSSLSLSLSLSL